MKTPAQNAALRKPRYLYGFRRAAFRAGRFEPEKDVLGWSLLTNVVYDYRPEVLEQLAKHGIRPKSSTPPQAAMDHLRDLYCFELRQLRARLLGGNILKADYAGHVVALRKQYMLVSIPTRLWTEENV